MSFISKLSASSKVKKQEFIFMVERLCLDVKAKLSKRLTGANHFVATVAAILQIREYELSYVDKSNKTVLKLIK